MFLFFSLAEKKNPWRSMKNQILRETDELISKKHNHLFIEQSVLEAQSASLLLETPVFILVTISPCFLSPPPPPPLWR